MVNGGNLQKARRSFECLEGLKGFNKRQRDLTFRLSPIKLQTRSIACVNRNEASFRICKQTHRQPGRFHSKVPSRSIVRQAVPLDNQAHSENRRQRKASHMCSRNTFPLLMAYRTLAPTRLFTSKNIPSSIFLLSRLFFGRLLKLFTSVRPPHIYISYIFLHQSR